MQSHILDTDFYKLSIQQFLLAYPQFDTDVEYTLKLRKPEGLIFNSNFKRMFDNYLSNFKHDCQLLTPKEADYLKTIPGMKPWYVNWLRSFKPDIEAISSSFDDVNLFNVQIRGRWSEVIWWETPLMGNISEIYNRVATNPYGKESDDHALHYCLERCSIADHKRFYELGEAKVVEFGTRRRFSLENQERVIEILRQYPCYAGTSNVLLAMRNKEFPKGTMAHELFMGIAPQVGYDKVYEAVLNRWYELYAPHYLIALTDTFTSEHFFKTVPDSILYMYDGMRQDSGREDDYTTKYIKRLKMAGITKDEAISKKKIVYSNGLTGEIIPVINSWSHFPTQKSFGWGTECTNHVGAEVPTAKALNMVIKLTSVGVNGIETPTVKISDDPGKTMGPQDAIDSILKPKGNPL